MKKMKSFIKLLIPPIILNFLNYLQKKNKKKYFRFQNKKQSLEIYYDETMAHSLDTWGERNVWIEIQHLLLNKTGRILDIACGTGRTMNILLKSNANIDIYGCDISDFLIKKAIDNGISSDKLKVCDATNLPYEENFFDYCYSIGSLEHFTESQIIEFLISSKKVTKYYGFHQIPMSRSNIDEGWIEPYQSYHNNSEEWWVAMCSKVFKQVKVLDSGWEDQLSIGKWLILNK